MSSPLILRLRPAKAGLCRPKSEAFFDNRNLGEGCGEGGPNPTNSLTQLSLHPRGDIFSANLSAYQADGTVDQSAVRSRQSAVKLLHNSIFLIRYCLPFLSFNCQEKSQFKLQRSDMFLAQGKRSETLGKWAHINHGPTTFLLNGNTIHGPDSSRRSYFINEH